MGLKGLNVLAGEIRDFLIKSISRTGGHLASNLGVVELTIALHYCFDSPRDKIIWDVGHQAYVHKLLTGRMNKFSTLRRYKGLSGFPKSTESEHDAFDTGHSSTSISAALGFAAARDLSGDKYNVVAVIGDGSMTGGLAFEALNNAGRVNNNIIVILNDNQMSISENVGALSRHLNDIRTAPSYLGAKEGVNNILRRLPAVGEKLGRAIEKTKDGIKYFLVPGVLFEELGFKYVGPIDGHNLDELINVINRAKKMKGPVLLHIYTKKGKGYPKAEYSPCDFHGVDSFDIETGQPVETKLWDTYSDVFGKTLCSLAERNDKIVAVTAAMPMGTGLGSFQARFPDRLYDVGIAEGHAVTFAAGMAKNGFIPVFAVYSSFLQRSYDQIVHDVCMQKLHVIFAIDRAGIVGADGETHQGIFDLSFLTHIPYMTIMAPINKQELIKMLSLAVSMEGPVAIRYPRGAASRVLKQIDTPVKLGQAAIIEQGKDFVIIALGCMMDTGYEVWKRLINEGYKPGLINPRFIKPLDMNMIDTLGKYNHIFVLEDNVYSGGLASGILESLAQRRIIVQHLHSFSFPDTFIEQGSRGELFKQYGMDADSVYQVIKNEVAVT